MISKTDYITYLKHPAWLWLRKNQPDFLSAPDENSQAIIEEGREFEKLAEQLFPEAIRLDRNNYADMQEWASETRDLLEYYVRIAAIHSQEPLSGETLLIDGMGTVGAEVRQAIIENSRSEYAIEYVPKIAKPVEANRSSVKKDPTARKVASTSTRKLPGE